MLLYSRLVNRNIGIGPAALGSTMLDAVVPAELAPPAAGELPLPFPFVEPPVAAVAPLSVPPAVGSCIPPILPVHASARAAIAMLNAAGAEARKLDGVAALETAQVGNPQMPFITGKGCIQNAFCREKPRVHVHRVTDIGLGIGTVVQANVM